MQQKKLRNNILLVNITRLGDMLQATPTIAGMKQENPNCRVTVLVEKQFEQVCHWIPNIDEVISIDLGMTVRSLAREGAGIIDAFEYLGEVVDELRSKNFDFVLNMSSSAYTALLLRMLDAPDSGGWTADDEGFRVINSDWARLFATSVFHHNREFNSLNLVDVFRCSAQVTQHPQRLLMTIADDAKDYAQKLIDEAQFTNTGPLISVQAGASQQKRQWAPERFIQMINILIHKYNARIVLTGTNKEMHVIEPIAKAVNSQNLMVAAGKTNIPQVAAILHLSDLLISGDTGPMHIAVAAGTPVVSMFLASAFGFETGPYSEGNLVLQPIIGCGPCNPNKSCARPDCHEHIDPEVVAELSMLRIKGDVKELPHGLIDSQRVIVYRSTFDEYGFCDLVALNPEAEDHRKPYRDAYRRMWLERLGGHVQSTETPKQHSLNVISQSFTGLDEVKSFARQGVQYMEQLTKLIEDPSASAQALSSLNDQITALDHAIEKIGFEISHLGPVTRMFVFAKENLSGSDPLDLASQMLGIYRELEVRADKLSLYFRPGGVSPQRAITTGAVGDFNETGMSLL